MNIQEQELDLHPQITEIMELANKILYLISFLRKALVISNLVSTFQADLENYIKTNLVAVLTLIGIGLEKDSEAVDYFKIVDQELYDNSLLNKTKETREKLFWLKFCSIELSTLRYFRKKLELRDFEPIEESDLEHIHNSSKFLGELKSDFLALRRISE